MLKFNREPLSGISWKLCAVALGVSTLIFSAAASGQNPESLPQNLAVEGQVIKEGESEFFYVKRKGLRPETLKNDASEENVSQQKNEKIKPLEKNEFSAVPEPEPSKTDKHKGSEETEGKEWLASSGGRLKDVLKRWAEKEGASFIWKAKADHLYVTKTMQFEDSFEGAIKDLISQYEALESTPVISIIEDPDTGQKTLLVTDKKI